VELAETLRSSAVEYIRGATGMGEAAALAALSAAGAAALASRPWLLCKLPRAAGVVSLAALSLATYLSPPACVSSDEHRALQGGDAAMAVHGWQGSAGGRPVAKRQKVATG
jgi:hypothetical protein